MAYTPTSSTHRDPRLHVSDAQPVSSIVTKGDLWSKTDSGNEELFRATDSSTFVSVESGLGETVAFNFIIDGGGSTITTGVKGYIPIPFACTITVVRLLADQSGSIVVDVWKDTYANYPPTDADSITASAVPTITTADKSEDATLTGWTTAIAAGDILGFNVDSVTTHRRATVELEVTKG